MSETVIHLDGALPLAVLDERGWVQGAWESAGGVCAHQAIRLCAPVPGGEQVRCSRNLSWIEDSRRYGDGLWVEVRAPRAVPEPETERVPWWEALGRLGLAGDPFVEVGSGDEGPWVRVVEGGTKLYSPVAPDGTVEVLKDGES